MSPRQKTVKDNEKQMTELERARKQNVAKRNDMIQKSKKSLSIVENKAVSYIFSKVKPDDDPDTIYTFDCQEFYRLLRWKKESYTDLRAMLYSIASQTFGIIDEETGTVTGEGTKTINVNFTANTGVQRNFTVTAKVESPEETVTATITQKMAPAGTMTFNVNNFTFNGNNRTGSATSTDDYVSISLANIGNTNWRGNWQNPTDYIQMGRVVEHLISADEIYRGNITITPKDGIKITGITVTYSDNKSRSYDTDYSTGDNRALEVSSGSYRSNGATVTWTGTSSDPIVFTNGYMISSGDYNFPRITRIVVTYAAE